MLNTDHFSHSLLNEGVISCKKMEKIDEALH